MTVFTLSWGTTQLHYSREEFLILQMGGVVFFGIAIPISVLLADRYSPRAVLIAATILILLFGLGFAPLFAASSSFDVLAFLAIGLSLMGLTYGPLGTALAELFPTAVRYTGASLAFNLYRYLACRALWLVVCRFLSVRCRVSNLARRLNDQENTIDLMVY
jgi:MFS family permease